VNGQATLTFALKVTDDKGATASDDVDVEVFSPMAPPENVQAESAPDVITLTWNPVAGAESYTIYYAEESFGDNPDEDDFPSRLGFASVIGRTLTNFEFDTPARIADFYFLVTAKRAGDVSGFSDEVSATSKVGYVVGATGRLNDTGLDTFANESVGGIQLPIDAFPQDANYGRDQDSSLEKIGAGRAGFDFIKVDSRGRSTSEAALTWDCVFDNQTGLLWEVKEAAGTTSIQAADSTFTWYFSDDSISGFRPGTESGGICNLSSDCNTETYIFAINKLELCGRTDWRLPTVVELKSIVDHGSDTPMIDEDYFPNTEIGAFWSLSVVVNSRINDSSHNIPDDDFAWSVEFYDGLIKKQARASRLFMRLVSGGSSDD